MVVHGKLSRNRLRSSSQCEKLKKVGVSKTKKEASSAKSPESTQLAPVLYLKTTIIFHFIITYNFNLTMFFIYFVTRVVFHIITVSRGRLAGSFCTCLRSAAVCRRAGRRRAGPPPRRRIATAPSAARRGTRRRGRRLSRRGDTGLGWGRVVEWGGGIKGGWVS